MKKILAILVAVTLVMTCLSACSHKDKEKEKGSSLEPETETEEVVEEVYSLEGAGLEEVITVSFPEGFQPQGGDILTEDDNSTLATWYSKGDLSAYAMILSHNGKAVMGSTETMDEWKSNQDNIADQVKIKDLNTDAFVYPTSLDSSGAEEGDDSIIEAVFEYDGYVFMVGLSNENGGTLSKDQKQAFYDMLKSIKPAK